MDTAGASAHLPVEPVCITPIEFAGATYSPTATIPIELLLLGTHASAYILYFAD